MKKTILKLILILLPFASIFGQLQPDNKRALLHVLVTDFEENPLEKEVVIFKSKNSGKEVKRETGADGTFDILLPKGDTYQIRYLSFLNKKDYSEVEIPDQEGLMEATLEVQMDNSTEEVYELDIHFETDKATIQAKSYKLLDELVEAMKRKSNVSIEVAGHTDSDGSDAHNLQLSKDRAAAVKQYLIKRGVDAGRISTVGYGESKPVADNGTAAGKARNRRTEVRITSN